MYRDFAPIDGHVPLVPGDLRRRLRSPGLARQLIVLAHHEEVGLLQDEHRLGTHCSERRIERNSF